MLGLSGGLIYDNPRYITKPNEVTGLIGWWDFTDSSTMYTDEGSTNVSSDGQKLYRIDNKAYTLQGNSTNAIGKYLQTLQGISGNPYAPVYKTTDSTTAKRPPAESVSNPISYAHFTPTDYTDGDGDTVTAYPYLFARGDVGNVRDDGDSFFRLTDSRIDMSQNTSFTVYRSVSWDASAEILWSYRGYDPDLTGNFLATLLDGIGAGRKLWTRSAQRFYPRANLSVDGTTIDSVLYEQSAFHASPIAAKIRYWRPMGEDVDSSNPISNNDKFQFWTSRVNSHSAKTTSEPYLRDGRMYRNGDITKGIDADAYTDVADTLDDTTSDSASHIDYGGIQNYNKLNLGESNPDNFAGTGYVTYSKPSLFTIGMDSLLTTGEGSYTIVVEDYEDTHRSLRDTYVYEVIYFNKALSDAEIQGIENYLVDKYGDPTTL